MHDLVCVPVKTRACGSELQPETDLALAIRYVRALRGDLAERTVIRIGVRAVEQGPIECIEVVHLQNALEVFLDVEVLSGVQTFIGISRTS